MLPANSPIVAEVKKLAEVLRGGKFFIPRYQRPYAWEPEHILTLLQDLAECIAHNQTHHFLGTVMIVSNRKTGGRLEISDGQQRIATFLLICANLCRRFCECGDTTGENQTMRILFDLDEGHDQVLENSDGLVQRVTLSTNDKATFEQLICGHSIGQNGGMLAAWNQIDAFFNSSAYKSVEAKKKFLSFCLNNTLVASIRFTDAVDSIAVFETLNARGKSLEQVQLACVYFYACLRNNDVLGDRLHEQISSVRTILRNNEKQFFHYFRCLAQCHYGHLSKDRFYRDLKRTISAKTPAQRESEVRSFASELAIRANIQIFQNLVRATTQEDDLLRSLTRDAQQGNSRRKIMDYLMDLENYSVSNPIMFALLRKYAKHANAPLARRRAVAKFVYKASSLLASFFQRAAHSFATAFSPYPYENGVAELAKAITTGECRDAPTFRSALESMDRHGNIIPDAQYKGRMRTISYPSKIKAARYVLARINEHIDGGSAVDDEQATVEHILPESSEYAERWGMSFNEHKDLYPRLGNLTLLIPAENDSRESYNEKFDAKKAVFEHSRYAITRQVCEKYATWDNRAIDKRQAELAKLAAQVWNFRID